MGNQENAWRVRRQSKPDAGERSRSRIQADAAERQRQCRARKRGHALASTIEPDSFQVPAREIRRGAQRILHSIDETLQEFTSTEDRGRVLQRVFSYAGSSTDLLSTSSHLGSGGRIQSDILSGLKRSLSEVKAARTGAQLATKHAILTAVVSGSSSSSLRGQARLLEVHPRNIALAVARRKVMEESTVFKWTLSVRKRRSDVLDEDTKAVVLLWWACETRNTPNRKEVVRKRLLDGTIDTKPTQYLMESQVIHFILFYFLHVMKFTGFRVHSEVKVNFVSNFGVFCNALVIGNFLVLCI